MKIISPSIQFLTELDEKKILQHIEYCGRICYKSEGKATEDSYKSFVANLIKRGHEAVLEHFSISVKIICDRGVSHEIVRHRMASYCQESTRYCKYAGDISFIEPCYLQAPSEKYATWIAGCLNAEKAYNECLAMGMSAQEARAVLPNSLKTELVMTANLREWRHFLKLRTARAAHPQIREIANMILEEFKEKLPIIVNDLEVQK